MGGHGSSLLATILLFGLLILVHEWGHFITAKLTGMWVKEFAIGFGPKLISWRMGETRYSWRVIPLGGFNNIAGMHPDEEIDELGDMSEEEYRKRAFYAKSVWARMLVIAAGSVMNLLLPVILFTLVFVFSGIDRPVEAPIVGQAMAGHPAAQAGLEKNDRIVRIQGQDIASWKQMVETLQQVGAVTEGKGLAVEYERTLPSGAVEHRTTQVYPEKDGANGRVLIGVAAKLENYQPGIVESCGLAVQQTVAVAAMMVKGLAKMITGQAAADVAGPIGVAQMAWEVAQNGLMKLLGFGALLSINLGIINLLPIPVLDGGHIVALLIEAVRGRPISKERLQMVQMAGLLLLLLLMIFATFKDVLRLNLF